MSSLSSYIKSYNVIILLILTVILGIILRFYGLSSQSYWSDEIVTLHITGGVLNLEEWGTRPPLYLLLFHFWTRFFGESEVAVRTLSIIFGVSSILFVYLVGKSLFGPKIGLISAFFMSVSRFQIYYSQELRYYSLYELLTLVSFYFYIRLLRSKSYIDGAFYVLSSVLLYYSHDFGILVIAVQNLYILIRIRALKSIIPKWILSQFLIFLAIAYRLINIFTIKAVGDKGPDWIPPTDMWAPLRTFFEFMGLKHAVSYHLYFLILMTLIFVAIVVYRLVRSGEYKQYYPSKLLRSFFGLSSEVLLVILWFFVPIITILAASEIFKPMYLSRYLILSAPALYLLTAFVIRKLNKIVPTLYILVFYTILICPVLYDYYTKPVRPDWTQVGSYIRESDSSTTPVVLMSFMNIPSFKMYNKGDFRFCHWPHEKIDQTKLFDYCMTDNIGKLIHETDLIDKDDLESTKRFWAIINWEHHDSDFNSHYLYKDSSYKVVSEKQFEVINYMPATVYLFEKEK